MSSHLDGLTAETRAHFTAWKRLRNAGLRREAMAQLRAFIDAVQPDAAAWVEALCAERLDVDAPLDAPEPTLAPMPHPLFIEVVLPVLAAHRDALGTRWPRWLAQTESHIWMSSAAALAQLGDAYDGIELLRAALAARPDRLTRLVLARRLLALLRYAVHEVPAGLLLDPPVMHEAIDALEAQLVAVGVPEAQWPPLARWRQFAEVWRQYAAQAPKTHTYAQLLADLQIPPRG